MAERQNDRTFTAEELESIRAEVRAIMETEGLSQADVARASGIAYGTFTGWLSGKYAGDNDRVAAEAQIWISSRAEKKRAAAVLPRVPEFQRTRTAAAFLEVFMFAQTMPEISVVAAAAGTGKTTSAHHYAGTNSNVWLATMNPTTSSVHTMLLELCEVMGIVEKSPSKLVRTIGRKVQGSGGLILIDEAQHLQPQSLDTLRSIYDRHGVGIALVGNEEVYARLEGGGRTAAFAQLFSRVGVRVTRSRPAADDMCKLIAAWGVTADEEVKFLKAIARKPGALRVMTKTLQLASMLAAGRGQRQFAILDFGLDQARQGRRPAGNLFGLRRRDGALYPAAFDARTANPELRRDGLQEIDAPLSRPDGVGAPVPVVRRRYRHRRVVERRGDRLGHERDAAVVLRLAQQRAASDFQPGARCQQPVDRVRSALRQRVRRGRGRERLRRSRRCWQLDSEGLDGPDVRHERLLARLRERIRLA